MKRFSRRDWIEAGFGLTTVILWVLYLFGPAGGSLMP